jgi:hypothetical protein
VQLDERLKRPLARRELPFARRRGGGPQSPEGRARASLNAIKHGGYVTARSAGLDYQETLDELVSRINPVGAVEVGVVSSLATELFRLATLGKLERERFQAAVNAEVSPLQLGLAMDYPWLQTHPDELRDPPPVCVLRTRLCNFFSSQLETLQSQCGPSPCESYALTIEALHSAVSDMRDSASCDDTAAADYGPGADEELAEPAYLDELDRYMRLLACGTSLLGRGAAPASDLQPLVDYWLLRNRHRLVATRRQLQLEQMVSVLTDDSARRARGHAMRHLEDCVALLELLRGAPLDLGPHRR